MKKLLICFISLFLLVFLLASCTEEKPAVTTEKPQETTGGKTTTTATVTTAPSVPDDMLSLVLDGESAYTIYRPDAADDLEKTAAATFKKQIRDIIGCDITILTDFVKRGTDMSEFNGLCEILVGETNRNETATVLEGLTQTQFAVKVIDEKLVIVGGTEKGTFQAVRWFISNYVDGATENGKLFIPRSIDYVATVDYEYCEELNMNYSDIASEIYSSFISKCFRNGQFKTSDSVADFWDNAEMFETLIDAYEVTKSEEHLKNIKAAANFIVKTRSTNWSYNPYNDDIAWMCIAFARAYLLTGEESYLTYAKNNFDMMYKRSWDSKLGGGLWWKDDEKNGKNSCINCPAAIAACYIGEALSDDSYYEKAKEIMAWEIDTLFQTNGAVDDNIGINWSVSTYHSTYNQGTFIGACTLLHKKYGDDKYLDYANKAAKFAMTHMTTSNGIIDNGEAPLDNGDLIGFKGIFTRWYYRLAVYTENLEYLEFLQNNAKVAYSHKNKDGLIWTSWKEQTSDDITKYDVYGLSTAVALAYNSIPWFE